MTYKLCLSVLIVQALVSYTIEAKPSSSIKDRPKMTSSSYWVPSKSNGSTTVPISSITTTPKVFRRTPTRKILCNKCVVDGGIAGISDPVIRNRCLKGCVGGGISSKKKTTTIPTTTSTTSTTSTTTTSTTPKKVPIEPRTTIYKIKTQLILQKRGNLNVNGSSAVPKTVFLWVFAGLSVFGVTLTIIVILWKQAKIAKQNRIFCSNIFKTEGGVRRDVFVLP